MAAKGSECSRGVCEEQEAREHSGEIEAARFRNPWKRSIRIINIKLDNQPIPKPSMVQILGQNIPQGKGT